MTIDTFEIRDRKVGLGHACFIIAEVGQAHDGSLGAAHAYIEAVAKTDADAIKFQTHIAAEESTLAEPFRVSFSSQDASRYEYWKRMEFTPAQWRELQSHANERGLIFLSSPFSEAAVDLLLELGIPAWKIGAGEASNLPMLNKIAETNRPVIVSTGMSSWFEIDSIVNLFHEMNSPLAVMQCTSSYPCPAEQLGLNLLDELRTRYVCPVGLSDHSGNIFAGLAAATLGANLLEVHVTLSRESFGPDVASSVTTAELRQLVDGVRFIESALGNPVDKDGVAASLAPLKEMFTKSVVAAGELPAGVKIERGHIALKKPGIGISAAQWESVIGKTLIRDVQRDHFFHDDDFE